MDTKVPNLEAAANEQTASPSSQAAETQAAVVAENATEVKDPVEEAAAAAAPAEAPAEAAPAETPVEAAPAETPVETAQGEDPEAVVEEEVTEAEEEQDNSPAIAALNADETVAYAAALLEKDASAISRDEVSRLRQHFAALAKAAADAAKAAFVENGGKEEEFVEEPFAPEAKFKEILNAIKEKKAAYLAEQEAIKAANLERKNAIIAEIESLAQDTDNVNRTFPRYRELQDEFNAIGAVPDTEDTGVWKRYQDAREHYSDNLKINKELRDYDFRKNLGLKEEIIADTVKLDAEKDIIGAHKRLQELRGKWREIGPVAKELRDDIWARFKEAAQNIDKRYQAHFEERKAREAENEAAKTAICERIEALDFSKLNSFVAWDQMTQTLKEAQEEWKKLGFASRKMNNALFNRFRATCDTFFALKAEYFKKIKDELARNLAAKTALVERAEALKDSTDWKKATDEFVTMQKEWKGIGAVAKKYSDSVWKRFQTACDHFFEQKKAATSGVRLTEQANLQAKRDLIKELDKITAETPKDEARELINDLQERWKSIGHVPFREKDNVYEAFRERIREVRDAFDLVERRRRMERFEAAVSDMNDDTKAGRERERQMRLLETRRAELRTYENNLGFLTATSKSGNSLVRDFERKIERLKEDIATLEEKIRILDEKL